ncbi:helix-turn-helix transcriptional regulator [Paracoccus sanguinis]|uniref:helix-turn-helix transcriptional regulator n=1 Tax=Paracoccus sanguinis TaxID=1545044 RepID=UPI0014518595|nr:helix-turn-helix domain-containing protein [Paracoccus sanguinis]QJD16574.1 helix-turn-helix domain-containing protein [Paracoccus sanguinis]
MAEPQLLTARDVSALLNIGVSSVWRKVKEGNLPQPVKIGGSTRWRRADIEALYATTE